MNPKVDTYISKITKWTEELSLLRKIILECGLKEELKWKVPCYTYKNKNILLINGLKDFCVLSFIKGVLLNDSYNILEKPGENSQSARIIRFTSLQEIKKLEATIKAYIYEAIEVKKAGLKVEFKKNSELELVTELQAALDKDPKLQQAFNNLTPGRQRGYNIYFSGAKQSETRASRILKYIPRIMDGKGINDCICGMSKKMPNCDGSHKFIK